MNKEEIMEGVRAEMEGKDVAFWSCDGCSKRCECYNLLFYEDIINEQAPKECVYGNHIPNWHLNERMMEVYR